MDKQLSKIVIILAILAGVFYFLYLWNCEDDWCFTYKWQKSKNTNTFDECTNRGYQITTNNLNQEVCKIGNKEFIK